MKGGRAGVTTFGEMPVTRGGVGIGFHTVVLLFFFFLVDGKRGGMKKSGQEEEKEEEEEERDEGRGVVLSCLEEERRPE